MDSSRAGFVCELLKCFSRMVEYKEEKPRVSYCYLV